MTIASATRTISKASTELGYSSRGKKGEARRALARAVRRSARAEIAEALACE